MTAFPSSEVTREKIDGNGDQRVDVVGLLGDVAVGAAGHELHVVVLRYRRVQRPRECRDVGPSEVRLRVSDRDLVLCRRGARQGRRAQGD